MKLTAVSALLMLAFAGTGTANAAAEDDLLEMSDLLDRADKQDFLKYIGKANVCTRSLDFACADSQLAKAAKLARIARDKQTLASAQRDLASTKQAEELRRREEEQRQLALAEEERIRVAQAAQNEEEGPSTASLLIQFGGLVAKNYVANKAAANAARTVNTPPATSKAANVIPPDKLAIMNRLIAGSQPGTQGVSGAPRNQEVWQDRYSNTVTSTGVTKTYDKHEGDIPGDVMASRMGSKEAAMEFWRGQGAKSVEYSGCGACEAGSVVRVVVDFGYIVDTHEYKRTDKP